MIKVISGVFNKVSNNRDRLFPFASDLSRSSFAFPEFQRQDRIMENLNQAATSDSGLTCIITKQGEGEAIKAGDEVIVNYTGLLTNGAMFDSSLQRNEPFSFPVGAGMVIKGWDEGLQKLRVGDHATLIIPPSIGYGEHGAGGVIPPNATLIFIIEVLGVK